ncbi:peroxidase-like isoform X2 [Vespula pensylvanica]|uniref:peroxidase-like isoform X2 n=1 Tax=Vespula pensylvanica TaxID=30213 RepID=UPI001CBA21EF|nr:peroxidase-like isoform X2 [Vespula pensylvanica]
MFLVAPVNDNRWIYAMHGLEKPMEYVPAGGVMAGSVATLAILWVSLQSMGLLGYSNSMEAYKLPMSLQNYLASYTDIFTGLPSTDAPSEGIIDTGLFQNRQYPRITESTLNESINFAKTLVNRLGTLERNIINAGIQFEANSVAGKQYINEYPSEDALTKGIDALLVTKASSYLIHQNCRRFGLSKEECARYISTLKLEGTPLGDKCMASHVASCNSKMKYRTIDGSCNNIDNPSWGRAMTAYTRILFPQYFDGIQEPRNMGQTKKPLPSARTVSALVTANNDQSDATKTLAVMQWSQFVSHDLAHTPVRKMVSSGKPISCCRTDGNTLSPRHIHPDCAPISVPDRDPVYGTQYVRCMNYVRSLAVLRSECTFGPLEQMNQVSHFLDGSTIYGSDLTKSRELREFQGGRLRIDVRNGHAFLPSENDPEIAFLCEGGCYDSGDDRVNVYPQLAVIHTIWHREHNRIAKILAKLNSNWTDEILYQEARRIVIAEIQHITYKEWLPILLGRISVQALGLATGYNRKYDSEDEPAVSNEAATAALRFLNSLMQGRLIIPSNSHQIKYLELSEYFFNPRVIESDAIFDGLLHGLSTQTSQKMDVSLIPEITSKLYSNHKNDLGLDSISLDIQRGRDHGLPGYNYYRKHCGLPFARNFNDFLDYIPAELVNKLRSVYTHPNDVDLVIGGMAERSPDDGLLGPTFRCLILEQFARTLRTDRFFYDSAMQPYPFTPNQLMEIRNVTLARIFCDNGNNIESMQPNVFLRAQEGNEIRSCNDFEAIPSMDLFAWAEKAKAYR